MLKPLLRWAGGKSWLIPRMKEIYANHREKEWVDPFCGGLSLPLALNPVRATLGDSNPYSIGLYRQIKHDQDLKPLLLDNELSEYYKHRRRFNDLISIYEPTQEQVLLFYYLNKTCFNGLCRFNKKGEFNTPFGKRKNIDFSLDFMPYHSVFARWHIANLDYRSFYPKPDNFLYLDPPYDAGFTAYSSVSFGWEQQQELIEWANKWKCPTVISNRATDRIIGLYKSSGFDIELIPAPRRISANGDREPVIEVLATKNL